MKWLYDLIHGKEIIVEKVVIKEVPVINEFSGREGLMLEIDRLGHMLSNEQHLRQHYESAHMQSSARLRLLTEAIELAKTIQFGGKVDDPSSGK